MDVTQAVEFFDGRTIGAHNYGIGPTPTWRGSGYDEGWERPTVQELRLAAEALLVIADHMEKQ